MKAWMLLAAETREYGGNEGYNDTIESKYEFDSNVPNHRQISEGDLVIIRDKKIVLGWAMVSRILIQEGVSKMIRRCPVCSRTAIKERKNKAPRWRCYDGHEFETPSVSQMQVTKYSAEFGDSFQKNRNIISLGQLRLIVPNPANQLSIQQLDLISARRLLEIRGQAPLLDPAVGEDDVQSQVDDFIPSENDARLSQLRLIKLRRGQTKFRAALISRYGNNCAISGPTSLHVLEAAHIIPYKGGETNHVDNGILLRADLHTLFDLGLLRISTSPITVHLSEDLQDTPYWSYHGKCIFNDHSIRPSLACLAERWRGSV